MPPKQPTDLTSNATFFPRLTFAMSAIRHLCSAPGFGMSAAGGSFARIEKRYGEVAAAEIFLPKTVELFLGRHIHNRCLLLILVQLLGFSTPSTGKAGWSLPARRGASLALLFQKNGPAARLPRARPFLRFRCPAPPAPRACPGLCVSPPDRTRRRPISTEAGRDCTKTRGAW